jgi:hypothetical protein
MKKSRRKNSLEDLAADLFKVFAPEAKLVKKSKQQHKKSSRNQHIPQAIKVDADKAKTSSSSRSSRGSRKRTLSRIIRELRDDIGLLALVLLTVVKTLAEKGLINEQEFVQRLLSLDSVDGAVDGKIKTEDLLKQLGMIRSSGILTSLASLRPVAGPVSQEPVISLKTSAPIAPALSAARPDSVAPPPIATEDLADAMGISDLGSTKLEDYFK